MVYGYYSPRWQWFPFDQALVRIVAPDQVLPANLGYAALQAVGFVSSGPGWACAAALVLLLLSLPVRRWRLRRRTEHATSLLVTELLAPSDACDCVVIPTVGTNR